MKKLFTVCCIFAVLIYEIKIFAQAYEVGALPGQITVSATGAFIYTMPLDLPPGRAGMEPALAFVYNSHAPSNIMGVGWGLAGFSSIGRINPTIYFNNEIDNVDFENDQLILDGNKLIEIGTENGNIIYRTEIDEFSKIVYHPDGTHGAYFEVFNKNGLIKEYGNTYDSRQVYNLSGKSTNSDPPLFWHLNKVQDRQGNFVEYNYTRNIADGELHPSSIRYTLFNDDNAIETNGSYVITFNYDLLQDKQQQLFLFERNNQAYLNKNMLKLSHVEIQDPEGGLLKSYSLSYSSETSVTSEYFLESVTLSSRNPETGNMNQLKPTHFTWEFYQPSHSISNAYSDLDFETERQSKHFLSPLDITGDGKDEVAEYKELYEDHSIDPIKRIYIHELNTLYTNFSFDVDLHTDILIRADFNNDGKDELVTGDNQGVSIYDFKKNGVGWIANEKYRFDGIYFDPIVGDVTGDGIVDLIMVDFTSTNAVKIFTGTGNKDDYFDNEDQPFTFHFHPGEIVKVNTVADFNGDGKADLALELHEYQMAGGQTIGINYTIEIYSFNISVGKLELISNNEFSQSKPNEYNDFIHYLDFNGDGRTDFLRWQKPIEPGVDDELEMHLSYGNGFFLSDNLKLRFGENGNMLFDDRNNDKRADIVFIESNIEVGPGNEGQYIKTKTYYAHPDGSFNEPVEDDVYITSLYSLAFSVNALSYADLNGNGINDLVVGFRREENIDYERRFFLNTYFINDDNLKATNVITGITNGLGIENKINYQRSCNSFLGFEEYTYPISPIKNKNWLVSETFTKVTDDIKLNHQEYSYKTPLVLLNGRGFMGFKQTEIVNKDNETVITSTNSIESKRVGNTDYYCQLYPKSSIVKSIAGTVLEDKQNQIDFKNTTASNLLVHLPVVVESKIKTWDLSGSPLKVVKAIQAIDKIDQYGNSLESTTFIDENHNVTDGNYTYSVSSISGYNTYLDVENWLINRPDFIRSVRKTKTEEQNEIVEKVYAYYPLQHSSWPLLSAAEMTPNSQNKYQTNTSFSYDKYGNVTRQTMEAPYFSYNNESFPPRTIEYEYEQSGILAGRFLTEQKVESLNSEFSTTYKYNSSFGLQTNQISPEKLETHFTFDAFSKNIQSTLSSGVEVTTEMDWAGDHPHSPGGETQASYYAYTYLIGNENTTSQEKNIVFYDEFGRAIRAVTFDIHNTAIYVDKLYNAKGLLWKVSEPYSSNEVAEQWTEFQYDQLGRMVSTLLPTNTKIETNYAGLVQSVKNSSTGITKESRSNAIGQVEQISDPSGEIRYTYNSAGQVKQIEAIGETTQIFYDAMGNKESIIEPNSGQTSYIYNPASELLRQTDARQNAYEMKYDQLGRITEKKLIKTGETTYYYYNDVEPKNGSTGKGYGNLERILADNGFSYFYFYDELNRLEKAIENHPVSNSGILEYISTYTYDNDLGRIETYSYPSGFSVKYDYFANGALRGVRNKKTDDMLWENIHMNARGLLTEFHLGNNLTTNKSYDDFGFPTEIKTGNVQLLRFGFNPETGNLDWRRDEKYGLHENFAYDRLLQSRLTQWKVEGQIPHRSLIENNGNIHYKSDITNEGSYSKQQGEYVYSEGAGAHAVTSILNPTTEYRINATDPELIRYTPFNKVSGIAQINGDVVRELEFNYGPDEERKITRYYDIPGIRKRVLLKTRHYVFGNFEVEIDRNGNERLIHYLNGGDGIFGIYVEEGENQEMYFVQKDYLGSYYCITDEDGRIATFNRQAQIFSFDPWGRRRNHRTWGYENVPKTFLFDRGFTGHEHLDKFSLINMNGRVYDPWLGRFLSPDPIVQDGYNSQSYNRYSYVLNNPLKFVDMSGLTYGPPDDVKLRRGLYTSKGESFYIDDRGCVFFNNMNYSSSPSWSSTIVSTPQTNENGDVRFTHEKVLVRKDDYGVEIHIDQSENNTEENENINQLTYFDIPVFGKNNGGQHNFSGGGDYAKFGTSPYGIGVRGGNTDWSDIGILMLTDTWIATFSIAGLILPFPWLINTVLVSYGSYRFYTEVELKKKNN